jgi:hypothetical protein
MENLQAQVEAQGAKIRSMKEAMKADPASHSKEALDNEIKELTGLKVFICKTIKIQLQTVDLDGTGENGSSRLGVA